MNAARQADGLLTAGHTIALLEMVGQHPAGLARERAARDLAARRAASYVKTQNTLDMLASTRLLARVDDSFVLAATSGTDWRVHIADWVARITVDRMASGGAHALHFGDGALSIDPMRIPGPADGLKLWLVEFGVASRNMSTARSWAVSQAYRDLFVEAAGRWNERTRHTLSQAALDSRLARQAGAGAEAEEWVLARERSRISAHPLLGQVMRISVGDVGAGYDIASFSSTTCLVHDRFLEVKSFSGRRRFFWSRNELEVARKLGESYHLYIVDRDQMTDPGYVPEIISAPYSALIETADNGWSISPSTYECVPVDER